MRDRREELARQLLREHREGQAAERLERERKTLHYDFEGWTADDELNLHIAGLGLIRVPADEVVRFANALLSEHHAWSYDRRCAEAATRQGLDAPRAILENAGLDVHVDQTGGFTMLLRVDEPDSDRWAWLSVDGDRDAPYMLGLYGPDSDGYTEVYAYANDFTLTKELHWLFQQEL